ncbi:hypothetical protein Tco_0538493 [Tanacetum coccineum]
MAAEVPQTLKCRGGQLKVAHVLEVENFTNWKKRFMCHIIGIKPHLIVSILPDDQMNSVINYETTKSTWDDLILYHEGPSDVKESRVMDLKLCYNTFKFKEGETLTQTFTRYKALMNELVNDDIKLSKLDINTGFINRLPKKWLSFCQSLRNTNQVKASELASLFGKLKYEKNLIDNIYETKKKKYFVSATPLSTAFFSTSIVQDFQDNPYDEKDTRSSQEYMDDLEEEYQARALLAKSKRFFKKGLIAEAYERDEEEVSSDDNEMVEVKVLMALAEDNDVVSREGVRKGEWYGQKDPVFVKSSADDTKVSIPGVERPWLSESEGFILPNYDTGRILPAESQRNTTDPLVVVTNSSASDYDSADESSVCSTTLPPLKKLAGAEHVSGPKTIKSILKSNSTFKVKALKGVIINEPSSAPAKGNKSASASKVNSAPTASQRSGWIFFKI